MIEGSNQIGKVGFIPKQFKDLNFLKYAQAGTGERKDFSQSYRLVPEMIDEQLGSINLIQIATGDPYQKLIGTDIKVTFTVTATFVNTSTNTDASCQVGLQAQKKEGGITGIETNKVNFSVPQETTGSRTFTSTWDIQAQNWQELIELFPFMSTNVFAGGSSVSIEAEVIIQLL